MSTPLIAVASTIVSLDGADLGEFAELNFGRGFDLADQGQASKVGASDFILSPLNYVIWRPASPSSGYYVKTWSEVQARINATTLPLTVYLDSLTSSYPPNSPMQVPGDSGITDCRGLVTFAVVEKFNTSPVFIFVMSGATLLDPVGFVNAAVFLGSGVADPPSLDFSQENSTLLLEKTFLLSLDGVVAPIRLSSGKTLLIKAAHSVLDTSPGNPIFSVSSPSILFLQFPFGDGFPDGFVEGDGTVSVEYGNGFDRFPTLAAFTGTIEYLGTGKTQISGADLAVDGYRPHPGELVIVGEQTGDIYMSLPATAAPCSQVTVKCSAASAFSAHIQAAGNIDGAAEDVMDLSRLMSRTYTFADGTWSITSQYFPPAA